MLSMHMLSVYMHRLRKRGAWGTEPHQYFERGGAGVSFSTTKNPIHVYPYKFRLKKGLKICYSPPNTKFSLQPPKSYIHIYSLTEKGLKFYIYVSPKYTFA